jgi:hypothetical protein
MARDPPDPAAPADPSDFASGAEPIDVAVAVDGALALPFAAGSGAQFSDPWVRRVRDIDDHTLAGLLRTLVGLRRLKLGVAALTGVLGAFVFGLLEVANPIYAMLIYGTLAAMVGLPIFAVSSLSVRRLFLREGQRHGLSRSASMLVLTRAERRARMLAPWKRDDEKVELLLRAVRDPDVA